MITGKQEQEGKNLYINEVWADLEELCLLGESGVYETFTSDPTELKASLEKEYGECKSGVYIDPERRQIGWVFEKKAYTEDTGEEYTLETWVTLHEKEDTTEVTHYYHFLKGKERNEKDKPS